MRHNQLFNFRGLIGNPANTSILQLLRGPPYVVLFVPFPVQLITSEVHNLSFTRVHTMSQTLAVGCFPRRPAPRASCRPSTILSS